MILSNTFKVVKILKPTKAELFGNIQVGHEITITLVLKSVERSRNNRLHATYLKVVNDATGGQRLVSQTILSKLLQNFEMERVK